MTTPFDTPTSTDPAQDADPEEAEEPPEPAVLILGTAHVVPLRNAVQQEIFGFDPGAVAVELDADRLRGLLADPEDRERPGWGYGLVAKLQRRVADEMGGEVGEEMLAAREAGMLLGVPVALVDRPAQETVDRLLDQMGWIERIKMIGSLLASFLPGKGMEEELQRALEGDPELIEEVARRFPTVKKVLIDERDEHMAERVSRLVEDYHRVVLVVGDAHVPGLEEHLEGVVDDLESVRVKELRERAPSEASFTVETVDPTQDATD